MSERENKGDIKIEERKGRGMREGGESQRREGKGDRRGDER